MITDSRPAEPVDEVTTGSGGQLLNRPAAEQEPEPQRIPSASACEAFREAIEVGLSKGRNAMAIWQDLVDDCGFSGGYQSVRRFVSKVRGTQSPEACAVIVTAPGEDYGKSRVMVRGKRQPVWFRANHRDSSNSRFP